MIISSSAPRELISWFHTTHHRADVLCIVLAPSTTDQEQLAGLIDDLYAADAVLGEAVSFLLLHPDVHSPLGLHKGMGAFATLQGMYFPSGRVDEGATTRPLQHEPLFRDMSTETGTYRAEIARQSARTMARFVAEFMKIFEVSEHQLPALCVLVRGLDEAIVISLSSMWSKDDLLELLRCIRRITDGAPNFRAEYNRLAQLMPQDVRKAGSVVHEIEAKSKQVTAALEAVARRHRATEQDREAIAEFVAAGMRSTVDFDKLFASLSFISTERFKRDQQVERTRGRVSRIEALRDEMMNWESNARDYVISIAERAKELVERREQIFTEVRRLERISLVRASEAGSISLRRIGTALERVNVVGDAGTKLYAAIGWIQRLIGAP